MMVSFLTRTNALAMIYLIHVRPLFTLGILVLLTHRSRATLPHQSWETEKGSGTITR